MTWDLWAILVVVVLAGLALIAEPVAHVVMRSYQWYTLRQYRAAYMPHRHSGRDWRENWRA